MDSEPPFDMNEPSARVLLRQLVDDGIGYARAQADFVKAELGERSASIIPGLIWFGVAIALALALIVALIVAAMVWLGTALGFGWAVLMTTSVVLVIILLLFRAGSRQFKKAFRPWQKP
jgi:uncharacterized membrane protein YqjE